jgi:hypothetical protein
MVFLNQNALNKECSLIASKSGSVFDVLNSHRILLHDGVYGGIRASR